MMTQSNIILEMDSYNDMKTRKMWSEIAKDTTRCCDICGKRNITGSDLIVEH